MLDKMTTQQRLLLATAVSLLFFVVYSIIFPPQKPMPNPTTTKVENPKPAETSSAPQISQTDIKAPAINSAPTKSEIESGNYLVKVKFSDSVLTIDNLGRISSKTLLAEKFKDDKGVQAQIVTHFSPKPLEIRFADSKLNEEAFKTDYTSSISEVKIENGTQTLILTQTLSKTVVTKKITFYPQGNYDVEISLSEPARFFISNGLRPDVNDYAFTVKGAMIKVGEELKIIEDGDAEATQIFRNASFASSFDRYYTSLFYNLDPNYNVIVEANRDENPMVFVEGVDKLKFSGYLGTKEYNLLKSLNPELVDAIEYGFMTLVAKPLFTFLSYLHSIFGNWGWSIVVLTIFIRLALYPLTYRGMISMQKMKQLAPEMKELQRKYKGNPQQLNVKMMELYKKHDANPLGGCFPLLLQLPIFFSIYRVLLNSVELQGEGWILWIDDLAKMDPYFILPVLMGLTMYWQQNITPNNFTDPLQEKIFQFLPLIFTFFFITFPSGLTLYWFVNNILSIAQQYIVNAKFEKLHKK